MNQLQRPAVFLDFDDVICLNSPCGGYDAKLAVNDESSEIWASLFDEKAKKTANAQRKICALIRHLE